MRILAIMFVVLGFTAHVQAETILMMVPNDFMWPEYSEPRKLYEQAGYKVITAGKFKELVHPDRRNKKAFPESKPIQVDLAFEQVKVENYDAITFVGGNGAWHDFFPNQVVHEIVLKSFELNKVVGLLCASTGILGFSGNWDGKSKPIAEGRNVVGYFRVAGVLRNLAKVNYIDGGEKEPAAIADGNLVTGRSPESSNIFAQKVIETLRNRRRQK